MRLWRCVFRGGLGFAMVVGLITAILLSFGVSGAAKKEAPPHVWWAPDSSWAVGGFGKLRPGLAEAVMAKKPPGLDGLKVYEMEVNDPAEYLGVQVGLRKVDKVVFVKGAKIVLIDKTGRRVESDAIFFCPDYLQTSLYDSRKMSIVVTKKSIWCNPKSGYPAGWAKFPAGSIKLEDIASFEVVGAIADTLQRAAK
jgi:hypothetical protein